MSLVIFIVIGYLLGSIPFGFLISKLKGIDIRKIGSGATGATNVGRALGLKYGLLIAILDILKAIIPTYLALRILFFDWQIALVALSPILGHIFPIWLNFKGGKGVASTLGVIFILFGREALLILIAIQIIVLIVFRMMSFASLSMASFLPLVIWLFSLSRVYFLLGLVLFILIWWAHRENLARIKEGKESKFKFKRTI